MLTGKSFFGIFSAIEVQCLETVVSIGCKMCKMRNLFILLVFFAAVVSCTAKNGIHGFRITDEPKTDEQMRAEYHLMRNNLNLAIRENEVVKGENRICQAEIRQLKKEVRGLDAELKLLNEHYEQDMARMQEQYRTLETQNRILDEQSTARIQELMDANAKALAKLAKERDLFNQALKKQKADFREEREALKTDFFRQIKEYEDRLKLAETELKEREADNELLNAAMLQAENRIDILTKALAECQEQTSGLESKAPVPDGKDPGRHAVSPPPVPEQ